MTLNCFQRFFTDNSHYGDYKMIPFMDSLAYTVQEFLYSDKVVDELHDFRMDGRIKLFDFMTLAVYFIGPSVTDFGKATIKGYIEDLKKQKNSYQREDTIEYTKEGGLLVTHASFELIDGLIWATYVYSKIRSELSNDESWINASKMLLDLAWEQSGYKKDYFMTLPHIKCTKEAVGMMLKHMSKIELRQDNKQQQTSEVAGESIVNQQKDNMFKDAKLTKKIFIVHGHNEAVKEKVARLLEKLKLEPIILHEQPDGGKTIIEKFEANSGDVNFAVILLTGDDLGKAISSDKYNPRARQNVIFEMGYFMGRLSRSHVFMLLEDGVEKPSDLDGIVYTSLKNDWQRKLVKELKECGYNIDANDIL